MSTSATLFFLLLLLLQSIIYKLVRWPRLKNLLENPDLEEMLREQRSPMYLDRDSLFEESRNIDYSSRHGGILRERFSTIFQPFVEVCAEREGLEVREEGI